MASTSNHGQIQGWIAIPSFLLLTAFIGGSALCGVLAPMTTFWFPVWAVFAVWVWAGLLILPTISVILSRIVCQVYPGRDSPLVAIIRGALSDF